MATPYNKMLEEAGSWIKEDKRVALFDSSKVHGALLKSGGDRPEALAALQAEQAVFDHGRQAYLAQLSHR
jgi:hypothetical protein